jgi:hypothetical protein
MLEGVLLVEYQVHLCLKKNLFFINLPTGWGKAITLIGSSEIPQCIDRVHWLAVRHNPYNIICNGHVHSIYSLNLASFPFQRL